MTASNHDERRGGSFAASRSHSAAALTAGLLLACLSFSPAQAQLPAAPAISDLLTISNDALQANAGYRAARAEFVAARELVPQAAGKLKPQVGARLQYDWIHEDIDGDYYGFPIDRDDDFTQLLYGARLTQALYQPGLVLGKAQAERRLQQAGHALRAQQDALLLAVSEAYFGVLAAEDAELFARAEVQALSQQLDQVQSRVDSGLSTDAEFKAAVAQHEIALAAEAEAADAVANTRSYLESLTGQHYQTLRRLPTHVQLVPPQPEDADTWIARAKAENPLVRGQTLAVEIAGMDRQRANRAQWPTLDLVGDAYRFDSGGGATGKRDESQERIGVVMSLPIYVGGQIDATKRQAIAMETRAEAMLDEVIAQVIRDVRIAHRKSSAGLLRVNALKRAVDAATAAEAATRSGYDAGTLTNADMLTAVERRYAAERDHAAVRYGFLLSSLKLKALSGNLLVADLAQINSMLETPATP